MNNISNLNNIQGVITEQNLKSISEDISTKNEELDQIAQPQENQQPNSTNLFQLIIWLSSKLNEMSAVSQESKMDMRTAELDSSKEQAQIAKETAKTRLYSTVLGSGISIAGSGISARADENSLSSALGASISEGGKMTDKAMEGFVIAPMEYERSMMQGIAKHLDSVIGNNNIDKTSEKLMSNLHQLLSTLARSVAASHK